jgi:hypothetical protein
VLLKEAMKSMSTGVPIGGSHRVGRQLVPLGVGHGETSMLPAVLKHSIPRTLREVGVREQLDTLAENCLKDRNPVPLTTKEQVLEILEMAVDDEKSSL